MTKPRARGPHARGVGEPRSRQGPPWLGAPLGLAVVAGAIQILGTYFAGRHETGQRAFDIVAFLLLGAGPLALVARRRYPVAVLAVAFAATLGYYLRDYPRGPIFVSLIIAFVAVVMSGRRLTAAVFAVGGYLAFVWGPYLFGDATVPDTSMAVGVAAWMLVLLTLTEIGRTRRERSFEAQRGRAEAARRRASEERLRIAQELHDVLAHNISLISVQAGVALHLIDEKPEQARSALSAIKQASNEALGELRSVLDVLRSGDEQVPRSPTSGLAHLDAIISRTRSSGLRVAKEVEGEPRPLPTGVDLAAFRIIQEALTNVTRHAQAASATVRLVYGKGDLILQIDDDGSSLPTTHPSGGGNGIAGMRERAAALGGELEAGPRDGAGFRIRARLPFAPGDARVSQ